MCVEAQLDHVTTQATICHTAFTDKLSNCKENVHQEFMEATTIKDEMHN